MDNTSDYGGKFTPASTNGNGRGAQMTGARTDIGGSSARTSMSNNPVEEDRFNEHRSEEGIREHLNEPPFEFAPIDGNGFSRQDPRHEDYRHTSVHNAPIFDVAAADKDFNNPLTDEAVGEDSAGGNPYRKNKGDRRPFDPDNMI